MAYTVNYVTVVDDSCDATLFNFKSSFAFPQNFNLHGISSLPCAKSEEHHRRSVTVAIMSLPLRINILQSLEIFLGR